MADFAGNDLESLFDFSCKGASYDVCSTVYPVDLKGVTVCGDISLEGMLLKDSTLTDVDLARVAGGDTAAVSNLLTRFVETQSDHFDGRGFIASTFGTGQTVPPNDGLSQGAIIGISVGSATIILTAIGALSVKLRRRSNRGAPAAATGQ